MWDFVTAVFMSMFLNYRPN